MADNQQRYWLFAPGHGGERWEEFYRKGIIAVGWDDLGDLKKFRGKFELLIKALKKKYSMAPVSARACDDFATNMKIGDFVFAKTGLWEIAGFGVVDSDYYFDDKRAEYKHCRKVKWIKKGSWSFKGNRTFPIKQFARKTLTDITTSGGLVDKMKTLMEKGDGPMSVDAIIKEFEEWYKREKDNDYLKECNSQLQEFNRLFPKSKFHSMELDRYVTGMRAQEAFCTYLEKNTPGTIKIGEAGAFYIYWNQGKNKYGSRKSYLFDKESEAKKEYEQLKGRLEEIISMVENDKIDEAVGFIENNKSSLPDRHVLLKILFLYFPEKFFFIFSIKYLEELAGIFGLPAKGDHITLNYRITSLFKDKIEKSKTFPLGVFIWFKYFGEKTESSIDVNIKPQESARTQNIILYGPPGTGKTYNTINYAISIIDEKNIEEIETIDRATLMKTFKNYLINGQISFITMHQNYSYEDFMQGLRSKPAGTSVIFDWQDGVFKKVADSALRNYKASNLNTGKLPFETALAKLLEPIEMGTASEVKIKMISSEFYITEQSETTIYFRKKSGSTAHTLSKNTLSEMYEVESNSRIVGGLQPYYNPLLKELIAIGKSGFSSKHKEEEKNFVVIIDEINRANISRVFGELITLLEPDKRYGREMELPITLPSGQTFYLSPNLYIIGTMNTADRSIALVDIALRRRFDFIDFYPDYDLIQESKYADILRRINESIKVEKKNRDYQIGHSYFMGIDDDDDFKTVMNKKIIPLLNEYFVNNSEKVKDILEQAGMEVYVDGISGIVRVD